MMQLSICNGGRCFVKVVWTALLLWNRLTGWNWYGLRPWGLKMRKIPQRSNYMRGMDTRGLHRFGKYRPYRYSLVDTWTGIEKPVFDTYRLTREMKLSDHEDLYFHVFPLAKLPKIAPSRHDKPWVPAAFSVIGWIDQGLRAAANENQAYNWHLAY